MAVVVGIDLHGTLIENDEKFSAGSQAELLELLKNKPRNIKLFVCTGNDLPFVERKIGSFYDFFDGAVLETGCVVSRDAGTENILVEIDNAAKIKDLEQELREQNYPQIYKFARRLSSISMFTKHGESLEEFYQLILQKLEHNSFCRVTRSSVAVDIIPNGFDKYSGLSHFAEAGDQIFALADSLNDLELLKKADLSLLPGNHHPKLPELIGDDSKLKIFDRPATFGVIDALRHVFENYGER